MASVCCVVVTQDLRQWKSQPEIWSYRCIFFCVYRPYKESVSKEMKNDDDLNLHGMIRLSGWLRKWFTIDDLTFSTW